MENLNLQRTSNPFNKHIIASGHIINADGLGRILEIDFINEDPEMPDVFGHLYWSEEDAHEHDDLLEQCQFRQTGHQARRP